MKELDEILLELLPKGAESALSAPEIQQMLGLPARRDVNFLVHRLRVKGVVILSNNQGYFLPESKAEIHDFVKSMRSRTKAIKCATLSAEKALRGDKP